MSDAENEAPNANGKRVNALELGPCKKVYVLLHAPLSLYHSDQLSLAPKQICLYIMAGTSAVLYMLCVTSKRC